MAFIPRDADPLVAVLIDSFGEIEIRIEGDQRAPSAMLAISVHPQTDPEEVRDAIADWLDDHGESPDTASISPPIDTVPGSVEWPAVENQ